MRFSLLAALVASAAAQGFGGVSAGQTDNNPLGTTNALASNTLGDEAGAVDGAKMEAPLLTKLTLTADYATAPTGGNREIAMAGNSASVYGATMTNVLRFNRNMTLAADKDMAASGLEVQEITAMTANEAYVFVAGKKADTSHHVWKLNKDTLAVVCTTPILDLSYAMECSADHLFVGYSIAPAKIGMFDVTAASCAESGASPLKLADGEDQARSMEYDATHDAEHLYVNTFTAPGKVVKVKVTDSEFARVDAVTLQRSEDDPLAGAEQDAHFIYVATNTKPTRIVKINKSTMQEVEQLDLAEGEDNVVSMDSDLLAIYVATYTPTPKVIRITKENALGKMEVQDRLNLDQVFHAGVAGMAHSGDRLYLGSDSSPAEFQALNLGSFYVPTQCTPAGDWGSWTACAAPFGPQCGVGQKTRERPAGTNGTFGSEACPTEALTQLVGCALPACAPPADPKCIEGTGQIFRKDERDTGRTCTHQSANGTTTEYGCACPEDKPFWRASSEGSHCVTQAECDDVTFAVCEATKCVFESGRVKVMHHRNETNGGFKCIHQNGRLGQCTCFCKQKDESPSQDGIDHLNLLEDGHPNYSS